MPRKNLGKKLDVNGTLQDLGNTLSDEDLEKLDGIEEGAQKNVQADWEATEGDSFIKNKPDVVTTSTSQTLYRKNFNQVTINVGTSSTASSTATKIVTLSNFELKTGAIIDVKFSNGSYYDTGTTTGLELSLNVNSTGAKKIINYISSGAANNYHSKNQYKKWNAGDTVRFRYDGTYWTLVANLTTMTSYLAPVFRFPLRYNKSDGSSTYWYGTENLDLTHLLPSTVQYVSQSLTDVQKTQARTNIGAGTSNFSGNYNDLSNKPSLFSGNYNDLIDRPTIPTEYVKSISQSTVTADQFIDVNGDRTITTFKDANGSTLKQITSWVYKEAIGDPTNATTNGKSGLMKPLDKIKLDSINLQANQFAQEEYNKSRNLFDKNNYNVLNDMYVASSDIGQSSGTKTIYIPCNPNTTYYVYKNNSARFKVSTTNGVPALWTSLTTTPIEIIGSEEARQKITITTSANSHYLVVFLYHSTDTLSFEEVISSLGIYTSKINGEIVHKNETEQMFLQNEFGNSANLLSFPYADTTRSANGITFTVNKDGTITISGTPTVNEVLFLKRGTFVMPKGTYTMSSNYLGQGVYIESYTNYFGFLNLNQSKTTFTLTEDTTFDSMYLVVKAGYTVNSTLKLMLNEGTEALTFQPYNANKQITNQQAKFLMSEYDKSKNLFNGNLQYGAYIFANGNYTWTAEYRCNTNLINVKPSSTITLSFNGTYDLWSCGFVFYNNGAFVSSVSNTLTATVPSNANQVGFNIFIGSNTFDITNIQLEYGTATDYQPYNGEIVHKEDIGYVLWENASPTSQFTGSLDSKESMTNFEFIGIEVARNNSGSAGGQIFWIKPETSKIYYLSFIYVSGGSEYRYSRSCSITGATTMSFGSAYIGTSEINAQMIPLRILGFRRK